MLKLSFWAVVCVIGFPLGLGLFAIRVLESWGLTAFFVTCGLIIWAVIHSDDKERAQKRLSAELTAQHYASLPAFRHAQQRPGLPAAGQEQLMLPASQPELPARPSVLLVGPVEPEGSEPSRSHK